MLIVKKIILLSLCLILISCKEKENAIRVGMHAWPGYEYFYLAQERGFFEKRGIKVEVVEFDSAADSIRAFDRGDIDAFCGTSVELINAQLDSTFKAKAIHVIDFSNGADQIIATSAISDMADIRGKRIAFESGTLDYVTWFYALKSAGLSFSDVEIESIPQNELLNAFKEKRIDAAATYPPTSVRIAEEKWGHTVFDSRAIPGIIVDLLAVNISLLDNRKADLVLMVKALYDAQHYTEQNPADAYALMAARERIESESFKKSMLGIHMVGLDEQYGLLKEGAKIYEAMQAAQLTLKETGRAIPNGLIDSVYGTDVAQEVMTP